MNEGPPQRSADGVDLTLIDWFLELTPAQRLDALQSFVDDVEAIRALNDRVP